MYAVASSTLCFGACTFGAAGSFDAARLTFFAGGIAAVGTQFKASDVAVFEFACVTNTLYG
jgi:hypothetical protein